MFSGLKNLVLDPFVLPNEMLSVFGLKLSFCLSCKFYETNFVGNLQICFLCVFLSVLQVRRPLFWHKLCFVGIENAFLKADFSKIVKKEATKTVLETKL